MSFIALLFEIIRRWINIMVQFLKVVHSRRLPNYKKLVKFGNISITIVTPRF